MCAFRSRAVAYVDCAELCVVCEAAFCDVDEEVEVLIAELKRVGSSKISANRSAFLDSNSALRRRSRMGFVAAFMPVLECEEENEVTASSSLGIEVLSLVVSAARAGRVVVRLDRWSEEAIIALWEREERARSERRVEWCDWERDVGSLSEREERGRVRRRER